MWVYRYIATFFKKVFSLDHLAMWPLTQILQGDNFSFNIVCIRQEENVEVQKLKYNNWSMEMESQMWEENLSLSSAYSTDSWLCVEAL